MAKEKISHLKSVLGRSWKKRLALCSSEPNTTDHYLSIANNVGVVLSSSDLISHPVPRYLSAEQRELVVV